MRPYGKSIDTCASALVIVAGVLDGDGELVLLGKLQTSLDVLDLEGIDIIVGHSALVAGGIVYACRAIRTQGAFLAASHASAKRRVMVAPKRLDEIFRIRQAIFDCLALLCIWHILAKPPCILVAGEAREARRCCDI